MRNTPQSRQVDAGQRIPVPYTRQRPGPGWFSRALVIRVAAKVGEVLLEHHAAARWPVAVGIAGGGANALDARHPGGVIRVIVLRPQRFDGTGRRPERSADLSRPARTHPKARPDRTELARPSALVFFSAACGTGARESGDESLPGRAIALICAVALRQQSARDRRFAVGRRESASPMTTRSELRLVEFAVTAAPQIRQGGRRRRPPTSARPTLRAGFLDRPHLRFRRRVGRTAASRRRSADRLRVAR